MATSAPSPAEILESFPATPTKLDCPLTYQTLKDLRDTLKTNAASVDTMIGGGLYGHLGLILPFHVYNTPIPTQPGTNAWINPVNPGITPAFPPNATDLVITTIKAQHA